MENYEKESMLGLVNSEKDYLKHVNNGLLIFTFQKVFDKKFATIHEIKPVLTLNKPMHVGFTNQWLMYDFHYNFIKKN